MYQDNHFKTNTFYLAAFLLSRGLELVGVQVGAAGKATFIFINSNEIDDLVRVFNFGNEDDQNFQVSFKKVELAIKKLKALIYE
jgi:hypothetical protein